LIEQGLTSPSTQYPTNSSKVLKEPKISI